MNNNEMLFEILSNSADNVYIFQNDMRRNYSMWSDNAVAYFNLPEDYHTNILHEWLEKIHPDDRDEYMKDVNAVFAGEQDRHHVQYRVKNRYGDYVWVQCVGNVEKDDDGNLVMFAGIITRLDNQSKYDPLTKKLTVQQFNTKRELVDRETVFLFGMDKFRKVIHNFGYNVGNELLIALANELEYPMMNQEIYRMVGDEFLVVIPEMSKQRANEFFLDVLKRFQAYCVEHNYSKHITFSCSAEKISNKMTDKETILKHLEHAMSQAKTLGGGRIVFFSKELEVLNRRKFEVSLALENSIANNFKGFEVYYQPIASVSDKCVYMAEALLRFHCDELGWVMPNEFIPILEEERIIQEVGIWVMEQVVKQNSIWNDSHKRVVTSVNVSYLQLYNDLFIEKLIDTVEKYKASPQNIVVELTESCKVLYPELLSSMFSKLIKKGFYIALDDFGMDNSSLTMIRDVPITTVKIDHSFVRKLTGDDSATDKANMVVVLGIITMCKKLSYHVVVEGIETENIAEIMKKSGADFLQGYYYSKPVSAMEVEKFFSK